MTPQTATLVVSICATAHYVIAMVMALYARHRVKYLALAWIMGIFGAILTALAPYENIVTGRPGMLHPMMMLSLVVVSYLQSIYPLSIPMPGYLQWGRMWKYALPAIVLIIIYLVNLLLGARILIVHSLGELRPHLLAVDLLLRMSAMALSCWYILNIFRLPHRLTHVPMPRYLYGYSIAVGLSVIFYMLVAVAYSPLYIIIYIGVFTVLNLYLCFRTLESMALELPKPEVEQVVPDAPTEEEIRKAEEDFNETNLRLFQRLQYWMQHNTEVWTDNTFVRDRLVEATGINRHLMLQAVRSQGHNNVHEYINSYRIAELKRRIKRGSITTLAECQDVGFGTIKTARSCFLKETGWKLDDYLENYRASK
ncbi:MAG: hypothetical protein HUK02_03565 [Bacteroidaceae bacterium]|nr:hypothetical protein [Bacteroidaceae bacterium]